MLTYANMQGLDREHALMLTGALPSLMLNHLQVQHTSAYVSIHRAYVSIRLMLTGALPSLMLNHLQVQHTSAYVSTRAYVSNREHTPVYVEHT
jgi:hypothetical protein